MYALSDFKELNVREFEEGQTIGLPAVSLILPDSCGYLFPMIRYEFAHDISARIADIIHSLPMSHVDGSRVVCMRSRGSGSRRVVARCHGLPRIMQLALNQEPHYVIEVISERFDKLGTEEQTKILIHELMHIPSSFGGGFRPHRPYVTQKKVEKMYKKFMRARSGDSR